MSLLIPTLEDVQDAHNEGEDRKIYEAKLQELREANPAAYAWDFEVVKGFFKQADEETDDASFNYALQDMGRKRSWEDIVHDLDGLNDQAGPNEVYKLIFLARHGQGYHNIVLNKYGYEEWNRKWCMETKDGEQTYAPDPPLTALGERQAEENHQLWLDQIKKGGPIPSKFYVSPMQRSSQTLVITWRDIKPENNQPVITEILRETAGAFPIDKRSSKAVIAERFSKHGFVFEEGFAEEDHFYPRKDGREKLFEHALRSNLFLQRLFDKDTDKALAKKNSIISTTSHAVTIRTLLMALHHRNFTISTGGMIPVVVKATKVCP